MTPTPIIEARCATRTYESHRGKIHAVNEVNLSIANDECIAILGRSGSGKSTLLALLSGLCEPTSGEVFFAGRSWAMFNPAETNLLRSGSIGLMLQDGGLLPGLRSLDNVLLPSVLAGQNHKQATVRAEELLALVGLRDRWDAYPSELSGGQRRRVALARALSAEPAVLFADEPTGDLDGHAAKEVVNIIDRLRNERTTAIVVVTHDPAIAAIADRRLLIEAGRCRDADEENTLPITPSVPLPPVTQQNQPAAFEASPPALLPSQPGMDGSIFFRTWLPLLFGVVICGAGVALVDGLVALKQEEIVRTEKVKRRLAEEMAMQDLRVDVDDVVTEENQRTTVTVYLQNYRPERLLHVLGPALDVAIQREGRWDNVSIDTGEAEGRIRAVSGEKTFIPILFTVPDGAYDELLFGYLHVRIGAAMVVSDRADGTGDLFERLDAYYIYLRDPRRTVDDVRRANGWGEKATVPLWISMPSH